MADVAIVKCETCAHFASEKCWVYVDTTEASQALVIPRSWSHCEQYRQATADDTNRAEVRRLAQMLLNKPSRFRTLLAARKMLHIHGQHNECVPEMCDKAAAREELYAWLEQCAPRSQMTDEQARSLNAQLAEMKLASPGKPTPFVIREEQTCTCHQMEGGKICAYCCRAVELVTTDPRRN